MISVSQKVPIKIMLYCTFTEFVIKNLTLNQKNLNHIYYQTKLFTCKEFDLFALLKKHQKAIIFHQLFSLSCKPSGSRDRTGRAVVEVHGDRKDWMSPLVSAHNVCELLLYLHSIPRYTESDDY